MGHAGCWTCPQQLRSPATRPSSGLRVEFFQLLSFCLGKFRPQTREAVHSDSVTSVIVIRICLEDLLNAGRWVTRHPLHVIVAADSLERPNAFV